MVILRFKIFRKKYGISLLSLLSILFSKIILRDIRCI